jgi:hypothetical protein
MVRWCRMRMDKDQEVSGRNGFLGRHSGGTYIHSMCGGLHIQAHMVARTRQSHKKKEIKGTATTSMSSVRPDTYRAGFHCCTLNSARPFPPLCLSIVPTFTVRLRYIVLHWDTICPCLKSVLCHSDKDHGSNVVKVKNPPIPGPAAYTAASSSTEIICAHEQHPGSWLMVPFQKPCFVAPLGERIITCPSAARLIISNLSSTWFGTVIISCTCFFQDNSMAGSLNITCLLEGCRGREARCQALMSTVVCRATVVLATGVILGAIDDDKFSYGNFSRSRVASSGQIRIP